MSPAKQTLDAHMELTPGIAGGKPRIAGRRITVQDVVGWHERQGRSVDEITADNDLGLADVHAALAYYFDHQAEIDGSMRISEELVRSVREQTPSTVEAKLSKASG